MKKAKHQVVYDYITDLISSGKVALGSQLPTDGQLMTQFSVSRGTVGKAMRDLENAGLVLRRAGDGTYVKQTLTGRTSFVAVLIAGLGDTEFFEPICARIAQSCHKHGMSLIWGTLDNGESRDVREAIEHFCGLLKQRNVSGLFYVPDELDPESPVNVNDYLLQRLSRAGIRVVLLDRSNRPFPESSEYDLVGIDNFQAGHVQTIHLLECGCKKILYIARPAYLPTKQARFAGYRYAMKQASIRTDESWIMEGDVNDPAFLKRIFEAKPDGIVCFHDPIAMTLAREFLKRKINIPGKVRIIGVDDVRYSRYLPIPLSTIRQPCQEIADAAVSMMMERLTDLRLPPRDLRLSTELIVRRSTVED